MLAFKRRQTHLLPIRAFSTTPSETPNPVPTPEPPRKLTVTPNSPLKFPKLKEKETIVAFRPYGNTSL